ncbi:MAG: methyltransferase domain-containing protein [Gemmatimonadales bacterium]
MSAAPAFAAGHELLDGPDADPARVTTSLRNIARANRWFGGTWAALHGIDRVLGTVAAGRATLLDIGTGAGDVPRAAARHVRRRGTTLRTIGLERHPAAARLARGDTLDVVLGCAGALPFATQSVDVVLISQVLHHLDAGSARELVVEANRIARRGVVIADLQRSRVAPVLFLVGAALLGFDRDTRTDGVTSIRRGYTTAELRQLCAAAGVRASVGSRPGFRVVAWWRKDAVESQ